MQKSKFQETYDKIVGTGINILVFMVMLYAMISVLEILMGRMPAYFISLFVGLIGLYAIATKQDIRNLILEE